MATVKGTNFQNSAGTGAASFGTAGAPNVHTVYGAWKGPNRYKEIADALYVVTDTDGYDLVYSTTTMTAARTITLPTLADNLGRTITIKKSDSSTYQILVDGEGAETIDGSANWPLVVKGDYVTVLAQPTEWSIVASNSASKWVSFTPTGSWSTNTTYTGKYRRVGDALDLDIRLSLAGAPTSTALTINLPSGLTIDTTKINSTDDLGALYGQVHLLDSGTNRYIGTVVYSSTTAFTIYFQDDAAAAIINSGQVTEAAPYTFANNDRVAVRIFGLPIVEWA